MAPDKKEDKNANKSKMRKSKPSKDRDRSGKRKDKDKTRKPSNPTTSSMGNKTSGRMDVKTTKTDLVSNIATIFTRSANPDLGGKDKDKEKDKEKETKKKEGKDGPTTAKKTVADDFKKKRIEDADKPTDEQKEHLSEWVEKHIANGTEELVRQYEEKIKAHLPNALSEPGARASFDANREKNRYLDIICLEHTRVVLKDGRPGGDYIHANYVHTEDMVNTLIATQAPMAGTMNEFWRMILQDSIRHIFMLCPLIENAKRKSEPYWPEKVGDKMTFGDIQLSCEDIQKPDAHVVKTTLKLSENGKHHHSVEHHHWLTWPDQNVPKSMLAVFRLLKYARSSRASTAAVHCSAGIGRSGTFIAVEMILMKLLSGKVEDLAQIVLELREMRASCVQNDVQYVYLVAALGKYSLQMGALKGDMEQKFKTFMADYEEFLKRRTENLEKSGKQVGGDGCKKLELEGGKNFSTLPPGAKPEDFARPDGAGTGFSLDLFAAPSDANKAVGGDGCKKLEIEGGKNFSTLPPGAKAEDFARPDGAGTGFTLDLTPAVEANKPVGGEGCKKLEMEGGKNFSTLPPGAKPEDFARPDGAGTGFSLGDFLPKPSTTTADTTTPPGMSKKDGPKDRGKAVHVDTRSAYF